jgi:hypothetical protein
MRLAPLVAGLMLAGTSTASVDLTLVRSGVGVTGAPKQLSRDLDADGDGRRELVVAGRWHVSLVEEDANPRGYREVGRVDAPASASAQFQSVLLVDVPGAAPALLLNWSDRIELRDAATLRVKATLHGQFQSPRIGDVDGDGIAEIVATGTSVELFDPLTLASRGSLALPIEPLAVVDITGDARAELVSSDGRAYTVTRSGNVLSAALTWDAGIAGTWIPYAFDLDGQAAVVLHDSFGFSAQLATFRPTQSLRQLVPAVGPSFVPRFADANGDGRVDVVLASQGEVRALDIASGAMLWSRDTNYQQPYIGGSVNSPAVTDLDGDGTIEVAWADASYDSGVVAISAPLAGAPRWRSDVKQSHVTDWTTVRRADGTSSIAYLTDATRTAPSLGSVGFLDAVSFADMGGSALAWLPGYNGYSKTISQSAIVSLPSDGLADNVVVAGVDHPPFGGGPVTRWLWTFDGNGTLLSSRTFAASADPQRMTAAQVLDRPERQLVVAGLLPFDGTYPVRVEVIDYATGGVLWQSVPLSSNGGGWPTKVEVADLDADGRLEVVVAYGENVAVLTPAAGTGVVASYTARTFSLLDRGAGRHAWLATLRDRDVAFYDGISTTPNHTLVLPDSSSGIALFAQAPDDTLMFVTSSNGYITVRRYGDGAVVAFARSDSVGFGAGSLAAIDREGDHRIEIIGHDPGFVALRLDNDYVFRNGFD